MTATRSVALLLAAGITRVTSDVVPYQPIVPPIGSSFNTTTTITPWDSSGASSASGASSWVTASLASLRGSASLAWTAPLSGSMNRGSLASDFTNSKLNYGSTASGSSGSYLQLWQWSSLVLLLCCCKVAACVSCIKKLATKKKTNRSPKRQTQQEGPQISSAPAGESEQDFLPALVPMMPTVSTTPVQQPPEYGMYPASTAYTAPLMASMSYQSYPSAAPSYAGSYNGAAPSYAGSYNGAGYAMAAAPQYSVAAPAAPQYSVAAPAAPQYSVAAPQYSYQGQVSYPASPGSLV